MIFKKKSDKEIKCFNCHKSSSEKYSFCPYCGNSMIDKIKEEEQYGLLGREDTMQGANPLGDAGMLGPLISSVMKGLMKSMAEEMQNVNSNTKVQNLPKGINGIKITFGPPQKIHNKSPKEQSKKEITEEQIDKMSKLPRAKAKTNIRRFHDKVVYELNAPGIASVDDVFVSKLETGYEIKAIGKSKVYVNSLPIDLPLKKYSIDEKNITFEFSTN